MKKNKRGDEEQLYEEDQLWFDLNVANELKKLDAAFEKEPPSAEAVEAFVGQHRKDIRGRMWRELAYFWLVMAVLLSGMLWAAKVHFVLFIVFQAVVAAAAFIILGFTSGKKVKRKWNNG
ncbi:YxlC family protein [Paenibacillus sp. GCM10027627]|uniref:YxlC family protein n=1 Tax=unclassified Paenibacillus TaxID=185978 RepID=UPI00362DDE32